MRVVVTGSSGCLAAAVIPALCADPAIEQVTGIDRRPPRYRHPKFSPRQIDISHDLGAELLRGHGALVHMACIVLRGRMSERAMHDINVEAALRLLRLADACGIERLISLSSAAVYGSGVDVSEQVPLRPFAKFCYAQHKAELERSLERELPRCVRLRPHVVLGPHAQPLLRFLLAQPFYPRAAGPEAALQCVHESDVAEAIRLALRSNVSGPINLAAPQTFSFADAIRLRHGRPIGIAPGIAQSVLDWTWRVTGYGGEPAWMQGLMLPLTLDCSRARVQLGWVARYGAAQTLNATSGSGRGP
jgi:UDP-glucose 4-epimerase